MPRIVGLLIACNFLCIYSYTTGFLLHCEKPEWFTCNNGKCISYLFQCDGEDDCGDESDEKHCNNFKAMPPSLSQCAEDEFACKNSACIPEGKFCDTVRDCADGSDEYVDCVKELKCDGKFRCQDGHCVREEWLCDGMKDCPDGSDERHCGANETLSIRKHECKSENDLYLCKNQRCVLFSKVCDKIDNCGDGSDEGAGCENGTLCAHAGCTHECRMTPGGPVCICQPGYKLQNDNRTCTDIDECKNYGICDQRCINAEGSYACRCETGYTLQDDTRTCKADGGEATMVFSTKTEIRGLYLDTEMYFVVARNLSHAVGVAVDGDHLYWSEIEEGNEAIVKKIMGGKSEVIVTTGLHVLSDIAVDWITSNIYFTDDGYMRIGVCNNNGMYCSIIINEKTNNPKGLALSPYNGLMYWCDWGSDSRIAMAGMDGKDISSFVTENLGWPISVTIDYSNNRLYWVDAKLAIIESIRLDGTDRRVVLRDMVRHPYSLAVFENKLYWSDWDSKTIQSCNKFSGKDWKILIRASNTPYGVHVDHKAIKPKTLQNPCRSNPCSQLCVLNRNKGYTCACTLDKELSSNNHTCRDVKKKQHIIIAAGDTFIDYYHNLLGKPKVTASVTLKHITAITYDSLSGAVIASDQITNNIFRYDPTNGNIENLMTIQNEILGGMAFDYIGNNLYLSNIEDKNIEVYSLITSKKTIFYFEEQSYDIALVPEEGIMFVVFQERDGYRIDKMQMSGIGPRTRFVDDTLFGPKVSLCYDAEKRTIFWSDQASGRIQSASLEGFNQYLFRAGLKEPVSLAIAGEHIFWTQRGSNHLFWADKSNIYQNVKSTVIRIPPSVKIPHLTALSGIIVHEEHGCRKNNGNCSHVCLSSSATLYICACPPEMMLSADNRTCSSQTACSSGEIKCSEHDVCIKRDQWCNGIKECPNGEDEPSNCKESGICGKDKFMCKDGTCISAKDRCNSHYDCADNSDEDGCVTKPCYTHEFRCHEMGNCISDLLVCNGDFDCFDFSDELNCATHTCSQRYFMCNTRNCIPKEWECDGERDCPDGSDETEECEAMNVCGDGKFTCANGRCVSSSLQCDGSNDCGDESDEQRCLSGKHGHSGNCTDVEYLCRNTDICLPKRVRCNGVQDCPKNDDEHNCAYCLEGEFTCDNQKCIPQGWVCDKTDDCGDKSDEKECGSGNWINANVNASVKCEEYQCTSGACLPFSKVCDGMRDCSDDSDEHGECTISCTRHNRCQALCHKTPKGGVCSCREGYRLAADMVSCEDVNECENEVCAQMCHNTLGSFKCSCFDGYVIRKDKISCKGTGPPMEIITITDNDIRKISSSLHSVDVIYSLSGLSVTGLDANALEDAVYWSSDELGIINKLNVKTNESKIIKGVESPGVLAVDWITNNIYFNDNNHPNTIKVCNLEQQKCATVVKIEGAARVTSLVIAPTNRWLFWGQTTWQTHDNLFGEICRTNMMGSGMKMIGSRNIGVVSGIAIDDMKSRLYWTDSFHKTIESSNLDGSQRSTFLKTDMYQPFSMNIYENSLYWLMGSSGQLQKCKLYGEKSCETINIGVNNIHRHFTILHVSKQPIIGDNPCNKLNCDYMCVLKDNDAACICQDGRLFKSNSTCTEDTNNKLTFVSGNVRSTVSRSQNRTFSGILVAIMIIIILLVIYYYYRKINIKTSSLRSKFSFNSIRFHNPSYDRRDEVAASLESVASNLLPGGHEYTNPVDDNLLKIANESSIKKSEKINSNISEREIEATEKQDISLISFTRSK